MAKKDAENSVLASNRRARHEYTILDVVEAGIDVLVSADPGCLMHLGGRLSRDGSPVRSVHVASLVREALR